VYEVSGLLVMPTVDCALAIKQQVIATHKKNAFCCFMLVMLLLLK
jgi:hypothetical protein